MLRATIEEKIKALADVSLQILLEKLHANRSEATALKALDISARALGFGARPAGGPGVQVNVQPVVVVPAKEANGNSWLAQFNPAQGAGAASPFARGVATEPPVRLSQPLPAQPETFEHVPAAAGPANPPHKDLGKRLLSQLIG